MVFDAVYTPKITRLLREAEESGAIIVTGVEMFIGQAYEQFERFTGLPGMTNLIVFQGFRFSHKDIQSGPTILSFPIWFYVSNCSTEGTIPEYYGQILIDEGGC